VTAPTVFVVDENPIVMTGYADVPTAVREFNPPEPEREAAAEHAAPKNA
jgi:hypothetical protein